VTIVDDRVPPPLDAAASERMLQGRVAPDEAPAGYQGVARLVIAAQRPPGPEEIAGTEAAILAALMVLNERPRNAVVERARRVRRRFRIKMTAVAFAGTLVGTSGLATAGVLPDPIQHAAAQILGSVGIHVPDPANHGTEVSGNARTTDAQGREKGQEVSSVARTNGKSDEPHGKSDEPHGKSDEPQGKSDEPHGRPDGSHGNDSEHGRPDEAEPKGNATSPDPDEESHEPHGQPDHAGPDAPDPTPPDDTTPVDPTGTTNTTGNGNDGAKSTGNGNGNGGGPPA